MAINWAELCFACVSMRAKIGGEGCALSRNCMARGEGSRIFVLANDRSTNQLPCPPTALSPLPHLLYLSPRLLCLLTLLADSCGIRRFVPPPSRPPPPPNAPHWFCYLGHRNSPKVFLCMCKCIDVSTHICICICVYMYTCAKMCICMYVRICVYVRAHIRMYMCNYM